MEFEFHMKEPVKVNTCVGNSHETTVLKTRALEKPLNDRYTLEGLVLTGDVDT